MAFLLDKQKLGLKDWADLAAKLGVARTTFTSFETCSTDNPTEQLFDILKVRFPRLTVGKLIEHLDAINRRDVILAIEKSTKGKCVQFNKTRANVDCRCFDLFEVHVSNIQSVMEE